MRPPGREVPRTDKKPFDIRPFDQNKLHDVLTNPLLEIDMAMQLNMLKDVARGMNFLHKVRLRLGERLWGGGALPLAGG